MQFNSHNNYIDIIAQSGLLGFGCFVWLVFELFVLGWRLRATVAAGFARAYVYACLLYTSDAADERSSVDLGGRRFIKTKKKKEQTST